jgi:hypothetical protein
MATVVTKVFEKDKATFARLNALPSEELLATAVTDVPFCNRVQNVLARQKILTLGELITKTPNQVIVMRGMGQGSLKQIDAYLGEVGLTLKGRAIPFVLVDEADSKGEFEEFEEIVEVEEQEEQEFENNEEVAKSLSIQSEILVAKEKSLDDRERELAEREARLEALLEEVDALLCRTGGIE